MNLSDLRVKKQILLNLIDNNKKEIETLQKQSIIQQYITLTDKQGNLEKELNKISNTIINENFKSCSHVKIHYILSEDRDGKEYCGYCIKCKLDERFRPNQYYPCTETENIMHDVLREYGFPGKKLNITCDPNLASAITDCILKTNPSISDEELQFLFSTQLEWIRQNVSDNNDFAIQKRKELGLHPSFDFWYK